MVPDYCEAILKPKNPSMIEKKLNNFVENTKYPLSLEKDEDKVKIIAKGISAHGSTPEKGENAISYLMAFWVNYFHVNVIYVSSLISIMIELGLDIMEKILDVDLKMMYLES